MPAGGKSGAVRVMKRFLQSGAFQGGVNHQKGMPGTQCPEQGGAFKEPRANGFQEAADCQVKGLPVHPLSFFWGKVADEGIWPDSNRVRVPLENNRRHLPAGFAFIKAHAFSIPPWQQPADREDISGMPCPPGFIAAACGGWKRAEMMKGRNVWELRIPPVLPPPGIHLPEGCFRRNNSSSSSGRP